MESLPTTVLLMRYIVSVLCLLKSGLWWLIILPGKETRVRMLWQRWELSLPLICWRSIHLPRSFSTRSLLMLRELCSLGSDFFCCFSFSLAFLSWKQKKIVYTLNCNLFKIFFIFKYWFNYSFSLHIFNHSSNYFPPFQII
jgi:hypothetical protein